MKTAVVVGMKSEAAIVGERPDTVVIIGAGNADKLAADLNAAIAGGCDRVLSFGTCGALYPGLAAGQIVVGRAILDGYVSYAFPDTWLPSLARLTGAFVAYVTDATTTVATAAEKAALFAATNADVVDFETCVAARVARARNGLIFVRT